MVLSSHVIDHVVNQSTFKKMWQNQLRWRVTERYCRPKGYLGMGLIFAVPYGILGLIGRRTTWILDSGGRAADLGGDQSID